MGAIGGAGAGFGVVLDGKGAFGGAGYAFVAAVEEAGVGDFHALRQGRVVDGEAVVLGCDFDAAGGEVFDGLVGAAVAAV